MWFPSQVQVTLQAGVPQPVLNSSNISTVAEDDIDAALDDLQVTLEGSNISSGHNDITQIPELSDYLRFLKYVLRETRRMSGYGILVLFRLYRNGKLASFSIYTEWPPKNVYTLTCEIYVKVYTFFWTTL
jgi:hypothetical protein